LDISPEDDYNQLQTDLGAIFKMTANKNKNKEVAIHVSGQANEPLSGLPHTLNIEQICNETKVDPKDGLTAVEAASRLEKYGKNELDDGPGVSPGKILLRQVANAMTLVKRTI